MPKNADTLIIGAGPGGLAAGRILKSECQIIEAAENAGGLSASIEWNGAIFDLGGHSFSTPHAAIKRWVYDLLPMEESRREARCYFNDRMVRYPFQQFFHECGSETVIEACRAGLSAREGQQPRNYEEYLLGELGSGICRYFALPYNRKLWGDSLNQMAPDWASERVPAAGSGFEQGNTVSTSPRRTPLEADSIVAYPVTGGFGSIFVAMAREIGSINFGTRVRRIQLKKRRAYLSTGEAISFRRVISTVPLPVLMEMIDEVPDRFRVVELRAVPLNLVLVVCSSIEPTEIQRVYSADSRISAHKFALTFNSSISMRARAAKGVVAEISAASARLQGRDLERWVVEDLRRMEVLRAGDNVRTRTISLRYGYPVPTKQRRAIMAPIRQWLAENGVSITGRFAEWEYINSDEALRRGFELGNAIASGDV